MISKPKTAGEDPRLRILAAAGRAFAAHGYESATVRDICAAAAVNIAAVNYYFGDKKRLYLASVKHAHQERVRQVPPPAWPPGTSAAVKLGDFVGTMLERMLGAGEPSWQMRLLMREVLHPTDACRELVEDAIRPQFETLVSILDELCDGSVEAVDLRRIAMGIVGHCFIYKAAGDVVGMLIPPEELATIHAPRQLSSHIVRTVTAALADVSDTRKPRSHGSPAECPS